MSKHNFDLYLDGLDAYQKGNNSEASINIAEALGADKPTSIISNALPKIFERGTVLHEAILDVIVTESRKRK